MLTIRLYVIVYAIMSMLTIRIYDINLSSYNVNVDNPYIRICDIVNVDKLSDNSDNRNSLPKSIILHTLLTVNPNFEYLSIIYNVTH